MIATASQKNLQLVAALGADDVIDYKAARFKDRSGKVDVVFDTAGGETPTDPGACSNAGGRLVTIVSGLPDNAEQRVKDAFFIVEPSQKQLLEVARLIDSGTLKTYINAVVPFAEASDAYSGAVRGNLGYGKVVVVIPGK